MTIANARADAVAKADQGVEVSVVAQRHVATAQMVQGVSGCSSGSVY